MIPDAERAVKTYRKPQLAGGWAQHTWALGFYLPGHLVSFIWMRWQSAENLTLVWTTIAESQDKEGCYSRQDRLRANHSLVLLLFAVLFTHTGYTGQISFQQLFTSINKNGTTFTVSCNLIL